MYNFLIIGASGYIARKHVDAIYRTKNNVSVVIDKNESIGYIDTFFPNAKYFKSLKDYDLFLTKNKNKIDFFVICTPNYLHFSHIKYAVRRKYKIICEKPLVINHKQIKKIKIYESEGLIINTILQLRYNKSLQNLKKNIKSKNFYNVNLIYISPRGDWYKKSWKGDENKSGGIIFNLGIHFIDILLWLFGHINEIKIHYRADDTLSGSFSFQNANVNWLLSFNPNYASSKNKFKYFRKMIVNNKTIDLSDNFNNLHIKSYKKILKDKGIKVNEIEDSVLISNRIQKIKITNENNKELNKLIKQIKL